MKSPKITIIEPWSEKKYTLRVYRATKNFVACVDFGDKHIGGVILTKDMDALCAAWKKVRK